MHFACHSIVWIDRAEVICSSPLFPFTSTFKQTSSYNRVIIVTSSNYIRTDGETWFHHGLWVSNSPPQLSRSLSLSLSPLLDNHMNLLMEAPLTLHLETPGSRNYKNLAFQSFKYHFCNNIFPSQGSCSQVFQLKCSPPPFPWKSTHLFMFSERIRLWHRQEVAWKHDQNARWEGDLFSLPSMGDSRYQTRRG